MQLHRLLMKSIVYIRIFWILPLCFTSPVQEYFEIDNFPKVYDRSVQCSPNQTVVINDFSKTIAIVCNGSEVDTSDLFNCTGLSRISAISFMDCRLPTPNIYSLVKEFQLQALVYAIIRFPGMNQEVTIKDLPQVELLGLSITDYIKYTLQNLPSLRQIEMPLPDIGIFPFGLLSNFSLLDKVFLADGRVSHIPETTFRGLKRIRTLNLRNITLQVLPAGLFEGLLLLQKLELSYNYLESLPANVFSSLVSVKEILLRGNRLVQLPSTLFANQRALTVLDLSNNNNLTTLPEDLFNNSQNLERFIAENCSLLSLQEKLFSSTPSISFLNLFNNRISSLPSKVFKKCRFLSVLVLSRNKLQDLPEEIFRNNYQLGILGLDDNLFDRIPVKALINVKSLSKLYLRNNSISNADEPQLQFLDLLTVLALDNNNISLFNTSTPFGRLGFLSHLGLSHNNFIAFPKLEWGVYNINNLDLSNNKITRLEISSLPPRNATIDLRFNHIESISLKTQNSYSAVGIVDLYLASNPYVCDCNLSYFLRYLHDSSSNSNFSISISDSSMMICHKPSTWKNQKIMEILPLYLLCPVLNSCPQNCSCYQLENLTVLVNCTSLGLTSFPDTLPINTSIVHLENNFINEFTIVDIKSWQTVTHLYIDYNKLVSPKQWPPLNLTYLSLRNNHLLQLPSGLLEYIAGTPQFLLDIRDNSWICNCTYLPFKLWLVENEDKLVFPEGISCNRTLLKNGTFVSYPILRIPEDAFCPVGVTMDKVRIIIAVFSASCVCLAAVLLAVLHFGNKQTFLAYLYVHFPSIFCYDSSDIESGKPYDAFISYTSSDREEVLTVLREIEEKPPYFKLCIHERDWLPGYPILYQIEASVKNSRKTIVFLSQEFLNSFWCEAEFQAAYMQSLEDKVDRLIIVVKGSLPEKDTIPLDIQNLLATKTYLVWGERWFWEKLRYALPHYIKVERKMERELMVEGMIQEFRDAKVI